MTIQFECKYCAFKWKKADYGHSVIKENCPKCTHSDLIVRNLDKNVINYYEGSPDFPEKKIILESLENDKVETLEEDGEINYDEYETTVDHIF